MTFLSILSKARNLLRCDIAFISQAVKIAIWVASVVDDTSLSMMASLIDNYEQQYAVLTADITAKIGRIRIQSGGKKSSKHN